MPRPLDGITVVSLEHAIAAPFCTRQLADLGARVIKIERAEGDFARGYDRAAKGLSTYFVWLNRGKESICLDIKAARELAQDAARSRLLDASEKLRENLVPRSMRNPDHLTVVHGRGRGLYWLRFFRMLFRMFNSRLRWRQNGS